MPDRQAQHQLDAWRSAERAEAAAADDLPAQRRARATSRRARWALEDASRAAATDDGGPTEPFGTTLRRALQRLHEASDGADEISGGRARSGNNAPETGHQRDDRLADEAEFRRELDE